MTDRILAEPGIALKPPMFRNPIIAALEPEIQRDLAVIRMTPGQVLVDRGAPLRHLFFVDSGLVCFFEGAGDAISPQIAMVGTDGAVGLLELVSGARSAFATAIAQVAGEAIRMNVLDAARLFAGPLPGDAADLARLSVQALVRQVMETAAVNARDSLVQRLVRWLLMARIRLATDEIQITHEVLATMLGVRRAGVTVAITALQLQGLVRTGRGRITLLDIDGLVRLNVRGLHSRS